MIFPMKVKAFLLVAVLLPSGPLRSRAAKERKMRDAKVRTKVRTGQDEAGEHTEPKGIVIQ